MNAADDVKLQEPSIRAEVSQVLGAFERATGFDACLRVLSGQWTDSEGAVVAEPPFDAHRSDFCTAQKARDLPACTKCDHNDLFAACEPDAGRRKRPFIRTCYAGADEILLPIWSQRRLVAVLFVGQFTSEAPTGTSPSSLRPLGAGQRAQILALTLPLASYFQDVLIRLASERGLTATGSRSVIEAYVREQLSSGPTLQGLGKRLSLSPSRTSHIVRECCGVSFQKLVETNRLSVAEDLLTQSAATVAFIARQTGFRDVGYFCRYFKQKTGMTPSAYRKENRAMPIV